MVVMLTYYNMFYYYKKMYMWLMPLQLMDLLLEILAMQFVTKDASLTILLTMSLVIPITQLEDGDIICFQRSLTSEEDIH